MEEGDNVLKNKEGYKEWGAGKGRTEKDIYDTVPEGWPDVSLEPNSVCLCFFNVS